MASATYQLFRQAILSRMRVTCRYEQHDRDLCPVIIGHSKGLEKVLAYQVGGTSSKGLPQTGEWKCLFLAKVRDPAMRAGPWREGERHSRGQSCVQEVDLDINVHVRKRR